MIVRTADTFLKVSGWDSGYASVKKVLKHYMRKIGSEKTRRNLINILYALCKHSGKNPDELVKLSVQEASDIVQSFLDRLRESGMSVRYINVVLTYLKTFFKVNASKAKMS